MKLSREVKVGLVVLSALAIFYFGFNYLKGVSVFSNSKTFYSVYPNASGLGAGKTVQINGVNIGSVRRVELMHDMSGRILVEFSVDNEYVKIPKNTVAKITSLDLFNTKAIVLLPGNSDAIAVSGDTLFSEVEGDLKAEVDKRLRPLEKKTNDLIASLDSVVTTVKQIFDENGRKNLVQSFESINKSFHSFEKIMNKANTVFDREEQKIAGITTSMNSIFGNIQKNNKQITTILENFSAVSDSLVKSDLINVVTKAGTAMENVAVVMEKINKGEGTMGMLINNDSLYTNLQNSSRELDLLLEDVRINPKRYVHFSIFGRKEKEADKPKKRERK